MQKQLIFWLILLLSTSLYGQEVYPLWEKVEIPFYKENDLKEYEKEAYGTLCVFDITHPTITVFKAKGKHKTDKAVLIMPGGGYGLVAMYHEGYDVAKKLAENGITAAVLKYRLPNLKSCTVPESVPLADARKGLSLLRSFADKYSFDASKVGVMGFSAGAHLATVTTLWKSEAEDENPNFAAYIYGVTQMTKLNIEWLENDLYHRKLTASEVEENTLMNLVTKDTPPTFLVHAYDDDICFIEETTVYAEKMNKVGAEVETHIFPKGGHGFGLGRASDGTDQWSDLFINWVKRMNRGIN
ncbi:alpha/beta hydrolase [Flammeovirga sp. SubArs3]|uniref:alpha/beta hydrolase n=1 Tax=Flammeovirga sp. SubArs3 TaxID=2995316 RepID=UPI00248ACC3B|nr:alpha/beta hydrolase [Flammeovirga sp. SubArs3]